MILYCGPTILFIFNRFTHIHHIIVFQQTLINTLRVIKQHVFNNRSYLRCFSMFNYRILLKSTRRRPTNTNNRGSYILPNTNISSQITIIQHIKIVNLSLYTFTTPFLNSTSRKHNLLYTRCLTLRPMYTSQRL